MRFYLFGGASCPSCANFTLKKTTQDSKTESINQVRWTGHETFKSTVWLSCSRRIQACIVVLQFTQGIDSLPASERAAEAALLKERLPGARWNISFDLFGFTILIKDRPATRRAILSIVSSAYDPLGCHNLHTHHQTDLHDLCCKK